jgi:thioredoxin-related protein
MNSALSEIKTHTDTTTGTNGVIDANKTFWTWSDDNFEVKIEKGTSTVTLYTTAKTYMQLKKQNTFTVENLNDALISSITIYASNATQLTNLKNAIGTQYEYTEDAEKLCVTIEYNSTEDFTFSNVSTNTAYISGVDIVWEK